MALLPCSLLLTTQAHEVWLLTPLPFFSGLVRPTNSFGRDSGYIGLLLEMVFKNIKRFCTIS